MKRVWILLLALILSAGLFSCDKSEDGGNGGGITYTADYFSDPEATGATLTLTGDTVTIVEDYYSEDTTADLTRTGEIVFQAKVLSNENGFLAIELTEISMKQSATGTDAESILAEKLDQLKEYEGYFSPEEYQAQVDLLNGKTVTAIPGSAVWNSIFDGMPTELTIQLNEENKTFSPVEEG